MKIGLKELEELLNNKELEVEAGVKIKCGDAINVSIFKEDNNTIIRFEAPFVYIYIDTLGKINIMDIKRKVDKIVFSSTSMTICIDGFPDITRDRND
jgi:hypothetical protein